MTPLRKRMIDALEQRNFPPRPPPAYVAAVAAIAGFYGEPDKLSPSTMQAWLAVQRKTRRPEEMMVIERGLSFFYSEVATFVAALGGTLLSSTSASGVDVDDGVGRAVGHVDSGGSVDVACP